jgi:hypothetical protein
LKPWTWKGLVSAAQIKATQAALASCHGIC